MRFRHCIALSVAALLFVAAGAARAADPYPTRPVHWIVPFPPGGATDVVARIMAQWMSEHLGQQVVIENRGGAGSNIGTQAVRECRARRLHAVVRADRERHQRDAL